MVSRHRPSRSYQVVIRLGSGKEESRTTALDYEGLLDELNRISRKAYRLFVAEGVSLIPHRGRTIEIV